MIKTDYMICAEFLFIFETGRWFLLVKYLENTCGRVTF